jgi:menaquinone-dependent protoporphyrinogen IX oxidase
LKTLVVYFSNSGNTKAVAEALAARLDADIEDIREKHPRPLLQVPKEGQKPEGSAVMKAAMGAFLGLPAGIEDARHDPSAYDLVVVGGPVWAGCAVPAVRSYLKKHRKAFRRLALFCTGESPEKGKALRQMTGAAGREPAATMTVPADDIRASDFSASLSEFVAKLASS